MQKVPTIFNASKYTHSQFVHVQCYDLDEKIIKRKEILPGNSYPTRRHRNRIENC